MFQVCNSKEKSGVPEKGKKGKCCNERKKNIPIRKRNISNLSLKIEKWQKNKNKKTKTNVLDRESELAVKIYIYYYFDGQTYKRWGGGGG